MFFLRRLTVLVELFGRKWKENKEWKLLKMLFLYLVILQYYVLINSVFKNVIFFRYSSIFPKETQRTY